MTATLILNWNS